jgi:hypothetical protein
MCFLIKWLKIVELDLDSKMSMNKRDLSLTEIFIAKSTIGGFKPVFC